MIQTSPEYKESITRGSRSSNSRILFGVYDVTAKDEAQPEVNTALPFTEITSILGDVRDQQYKLGTFERDYFKLDGSFCLLPDDANPADDLIGWWSGFMSDRARTFEVSPVITVSFQSYHSSLGLGVFFGSREVCSDFEVSWFDGSTLLDFERIAGNQSAGVNISKSVVNYNRITIKFIKTSKPYRYARLMEIAFGLEASFDNNEVINASVVEQIDPSNSSLPVNKLKFTLVNEDQRFNMLNPQGVYAYLQERQKIVASSGLLMDDGMFEYVPMGIYYLSGWKNSTGLTATLEAEDAMGLLDKTTYRASQFWDNEPVINVVRHILDNAGVFSASISASAALETVTGYIPVKSHREALKDVMMATGNTLRLARNGVFEIMKLDYSDERASINYDLMLGTPSIEQKQLVTGVDVEEIVYSISSEESEITKASFVLNGTKEVVIDFGKAATDVAATVTGGVVVGAPIYSVTSATLTVTGTGVVTIVISGKEYLETVSTVSDNVPLQAGQIAQIAKVSSNKLIVGNGLAVATYILGYLQKRISQDFGFWCDPSIQAGDCVEAETMFGQSSKGVVERQEITFSPYLRGTMGVTG